MDKTRRNVKTSLMQDNKKPASQRTFPGSFQDLGLIRRPNFYLVPEMVTNPLVTLTLTSASPGTCLLI